MRQMGSVALLQAEPGADETLDPHRRAEEAGEDGAKPLGMPRLVREMSGEMQLRQVRHGVAVAQAVHAEPDQRADIQREAVLVPGDRG